MKNINISSNNVKGQVIEGDLVMGNNSYSKEDVIVKSFHNIINNGEFNTLQSNGSLDVLLKVDPLLKEKTLIYRGENHIASLLDITNDNGILTVGFKSNSSFSTNKPLEIVCAVPSLDNILLKGSGSIKGDYIGTKLKVDITGSGDILLFGRAEKLEGSVIGSGDLDLKNLIVQHAVLHVKGSGDINSYALQSIHANVVGSGDITVCGTYFELNKNVQGSGDINVKKGYMPKQSSFHLSSIIDSLNNKINQENKVLINDSNKKTLEHIESTRSILKEQQSFLDKFKKIFKHK